MSSYKARFYDGKFARSHQCEVFLTENGVIIWGETIDTHWLFTDIYLPEKPDYKRTLTLCSRLEENARLVFPDTQILSALEPQLPRTNKPFFTLSISMPHLLGWALLACALGGLLLVMARPLSELAAQYMPSSWEESLGNYAVHLITHQKKSCQNQAGLDALSTLSNRLLDAIDHKVPISVTVIEEDDINAFAVPNGKIILFSGLIKNVTSPEELAGVIAHEMGHVLKRHPTQAAIRALGLTALTHLAFTGTGHTSITASTANELLQLRYNRELETEADQIGMDILHRARINSSAFADFFERMKHHTAEKDIALLQYLSTHPPTHERIAKAKAADPAKDTHARVLKKEEWDALQRVCGS